MFLSHKENIDVNAASLFDVDNQKLSIPIHDLLKGPIPQDNTGLVYIIKEKYVQSPPSNDLKYNLKFVSVIKT